MPISFNVPLSDYLDKKLGHIAQSWCWKVIDFAELKRSSISYFHGVGDNHETAISRWSRARTRAAKVGKGLSKSDKGQKVALRHWLEAIDPRHRYGHNLHFYYKEWLNTNSKQPFFYWLDIGEGKNKDLHLRCPRSILDQQCIKYLDPLERKAYEISLEGGKLMKKHSGEALHTTKDSKWIFVVSTSKVIYVGKKNKGLFQHSSFLAGGAALAAGRLIVQHGTLKAIWPHSGHYRPSKESFKDLLLFLEHNNIDLAHVQVTPVDEEETSHKRQEKNNSTQKALTKKMHGQSDHTAPAHKLLRQKKAYFGLKQSTAAELGARNFTKHLSNLQAPEKPEIFRPITAHHLATTNCNLTSLLGLYVWLFFSPTTHSVLGHNLVLNTVQCKKIATFPMKRWFLYKFFPKYDSLNIIRT